MRDFGRQLKTLIKKNLLLKGKSKCSICCEIVLPLVIIGVLFALLGLILSFKADYDSIDASTFSYRVNEENILLYGGETGSLNNEQQGVIDMMKLQVSLVNNKPIQDINSYFMEINNNIDMETYFKNNSHNVIGAVWFSDSNETKPGESFQYNIRLDSDDTGNTEEVNDGDSAVYLSRGFGVIQVAMDQAIFQYYGINKFLNISGQRYPDPYTETWQKWMVGRVIVKVAGSIFITAALMIFGFRLITDLVIEKETKIREAMKMMGLNSISYIVSWLITSLIVSFPVTLLIGGLFKGTQIFHSTSWLVVLVIFVLYLFSLLLLSFIFSIFFDSSKFCGMISFIMVMAVNIGGIFIAKEDFSVTVKLILSLFSPIAFSNAIYSMSVIDLTMVETVNWKYVTTENQIIKMLTVDCAFYLFLIWYLEKVIPGEYGTKEKWYFIVSPKYWFSFKRKNGSGISDDEIGIIESVWDSEDVERIPLSIGKAATISIRNLRKEFETGDGNRVAVNDLYLDIFPDQIHALLGPNGSGKSTTIGMLTGLISPTSGTAFIHGYDIQSEMSKIRPNIGCCLQTDIIWPQLTVLEHLKIYASLKGIPSSKIDKEAERMAIDVDLEAKMHAPSGSLSGGQKRKLCLGIAFIGRSDIIFIDEGTSGMDPVSRRSVWDFLIRNKKGRTIILTTHFLEEADYLASRTAIISHGKLKCDGSSLFLKNRFGFGYLLTCSKVLSSVGQFNTSWVLEFIQQFIPGASILSDAGAELSVRLPTESLNRFADFFAALDENITRFGILNYGISVTSLEEVFLALGKEDQKQYNEQYNIKELNEQDQQLLKQSIAVNSTGINQGQQLKGLLIKRMQTSRKDIKSFFLTLIIPLAFIIGSIVLYNQMKNDIVLIFNNSTTPLTMSLSSYGNDNVVPMYNFNQISKDWINVLKSSPYYNQFVNVPSSMDFNDYLIDNYKLSAGAINFVEPNSFLSDDNKTISYCSYYNEDYIHSWPIHVNLINDALLRNYSGIGISVTSMPFDHVLDTLELLTSEINPSAIIYFIFIMMLGFSLMAGSFSGLVAQERNGRIKRLLYISGCKKHIYWLSNLVWDFSFAFILCLLTSSILAGVIKGEFKSQFFILLISLILLCLSIIPLGYLFSYKFETFGKAVGAITAAMFAFGLVFTIASLNIRIQSVSNQNLSTQKAADIVDIMFSILSPIYAYSRVLFILSGFPGSTRVGEFKINNYWSFNYCGTPLLILAGHVVIWTSWILLLDYVPQLRGYLKNPKNILPPQPPLDEDQDVIAERTRLLNLQPHEEPLQFRNLHKLFPAVGKNPPKVAVNNSTLSISKGTCFGLLGMNGAGKTTTISMLSGEFPPTSGVMSINGHDLITDREQALKSISSCFQFDSLITLLSAREQLWLYCRIKGISESSIHQVVEAFVQMMDLTRIANSNSGGYSGGNKRKTSLSIAMLGNPSVVFLDEPSTGVDSSTKRFMWNVISELGKDKVIVLTSHSMAEVEALCSRITIMKDGKLKCLGTIQHIKSRFGAGYSIDVKFKKDCFEGGVDKILRLIPNSTVVDQHDIMASFEIENPQHQPIKLSQLFSTLSNLTILDDFNVGQTSLESVFLKLTSTSYENRLNIYQ